MLDGIGIIVLFFLVILALTKPLGNYIYKVVTGEVTFLHRLISPLENLVYRLCKINPKTNMHWKQYSIAMLIFSMCGILVSYLLLRFQAYLPLNPRSFGSNEMTEHLAFNTAISFSTNTNWQSYVPETTISYFSNMLALATHNWMSAAVGIAIAIAVVRGFAWAQSSSIGNFWVDLTRSTLYILLPISIVGAIIFVGLGVPQNFNDYTKANTLEGQTQTIAQGPVASQEVIKMLGTNGGGFFNANSAHPYENPSASSNFLSLILIFAIPAALTYTFGKMVGDQRQGWVLFASMSVMFLIGAGLCLYFEESGNPQYSSFNLSHEGQNSTSNFEGKEARFGIAASTLFATVTTAASCGAVNSMHDSYTPAGGLIPLFNILSGEVIFGGVGAGLYGILMFAVLAVFIAGLMVGRTPEYLGKKIGRFEVQMAMLSILVLTASILGFTAFTSNISLANDSPWNQVGSSETYLGAPLNNLNNSGPHGFSEVLYAYTSATGNNGSAFAGLTANTPIYNLTLGLAMLIGRFFMALPLLALAGNLASKRRQAITVGTFRTDNLTFVFLLIGVIIIVGALTYFPALSLGPIVENFQMHKSILR